MVFFRGDKFHRSWRDLQCVFKNAEGGHDHTAAQNNYSANVNYQPFGQGGFMAKRTEVKLEWEQLFPKAGADFELLAAAMSIDAKVPKPANRAAMQALYDKTILDNRSYVRKDEFVRSSSWCSNVKFAHRVDPMWSARRYHATMVAKHLFSQGAASKKALDLVAHEIISKTQASKADTGGKDSFKAHMQKIRKQAGNALLF